MMRRWFCTSAAACVLAALLPAHAQDRTAAPLRLAIAGLVHGHVGGFLKAAQARPDVQIVGIFEPDSRCCDSTPRVTASPTACSSPISMPCSTARSRRPSRRSPTPPIIPRSSRPQRRAASTS